MKRHQRAIGLNDEWLTPPDIISRLGVFDLDPCDALESPFKTAKRRFTYLHNGLSSEWSGRVWCNPPFNRNERPKWMQKMAAHNNGILLVPAACETDAFYKYVWPTATGILFLKGRPHFHYVDGTKAKANSGCTICLVSYGSENLKALKESGLGITLEINNP
jgi:hypothetical protein